MLPAERRREMARLIKNRGAVNTRELAEALGISTMTVRRDLKVLEERNQLELTWGGAVPLSFEANDIPRARKAVSMLEAKQAIARTASLHIKNEDPYLTLSGELLDGVTIDGAEDGVSQR